MNLFNRFSFRRPIRNGLVGKVLLGLSLAVLSGCSATTLRCGVDGEISYVDLVNVPQDIGGQARYFTELCGFAYEAEPEVKLNIIDQE